MQAVTAKTGDGGKMPSDFLFYDVCEAWGSRPSDVEKESAFHVERQKLKILVERAADSENEARKRADGMEGIAAMMGGGKR